MLPRATSSREIGQAQSTGGDFLYWLHSALWLAKQPQGGDKPYFSVQELSWKVLLFLFDVFMEITLG